MASILANFPRKLRSEINTFITTMIFAQQKTCFLDGQKTYLNCSHLVSFLSPEPPSFPSIWSIEYLRSRDLAFFTARLTSLGSSVHW